MSQQSIHDLDLAPNKPSKQYWVNGGREWHEEVISFPWSIGFTTTIHDRLCKPTERRPASARSSNYKDHAVACMRHHEQP
jgi:hypothetical protein